MLRSCRTRLCFRLCMSAVGAAVGSAVKNTAVPGTRCGGFASSLRKSQSRSASFLRVCLASRRAPRTHVTMMRPTQAGDQQRHPGALEDLQHVGQEERLLDEQQRHDQQRHLPDVPSPHAPDDEERDQGGHHHLRRDRDAVGRRQIARALEQQHHEQHGDEEYPVDARHVDLARPSTPDVCVMPKRGRRPS